MVGDTVFDVLGAAEHQIPTIAVDWGYGQTIDMAAAGAIAVAHTAAELYLLLSK
jgi:phosphoglycolate phosphatase